VARGKTISVVIPTFNRRELLEKNLKAIAAQTMPMERIEVIVVNDDGTDDTDEMVNAFDTPYRLRYIRQKHGEAVPYNVGGWAAENDFIIFIDDDVIPHPGMLEAVVAAHNRFEGPTAVIGRLRWPDEKKLTPFERYVGDSGILMGTHLIEDPDDVHFKFALGGNFSVSRELFRAAGGYDFDLNIYGHIDIEFGYRLKHKHGAHLLYEERAVADHWCCAPFPRFCEQRELAGVTAVIFYTKHPELSRYLKIDWVRRRGAYAAAVRAALRSAYVVLRPMVPVLEKLPLIHLRHFAYRLCIFYHFQKGIAAYLRKIEGLAVPPYPKP